MAELDVDLPKGAIKRIVKNKLAEKAGAAQGEGQRDLQVNKDAVSAFSQATKVFITYVTTAAHDICREHKRTTVAPQDILQALQELDFTTFIPGLEERLLGAQPELSTVISYRNNTCQLGPRHSCNRLLSRRQFSTCHIQIACALWCVSQARQVRHMHNGHTANGGGGHRH
jgi:histone H3/H4